MNNFDLAVCLTAVNLLAFFLFGVDKYKARKKKWRISEAALWTVSILGGSLGAWLGMQIFRHKTKHKTFVIGIPVLFVCQILIGTGILRYFQ